MKLRHKNGAKLYKCVTKHVWLQSWQKDFIIVFIVWIVSTIRGGVDLFYFAHSNVSAHVTENWLVQSV